MPQSGHDCGYGNRALMRMTHADWIKLSHYQFFAVVGTAPPERFAQREQFFGEAERSQHLQNDSYH